MRTRYLSSALCVFLFLAAQAFQALAYWLWIPTPHGPQDDLLIYLLPIDKARAILIMVTIVVLIVPFIVIALRYFTVAPLASVLGVIFGAAFIGFEFSHRSVDFFVIGAEWAPRFAAASTPERGILLQPFVVWNEMVRGWYFPLMLSYLFASCAFAVATWTDRLKGRWYYLAPIACILNAVRLLGRILSTFAGQQWLDSFNDRLYFPAVFIINALLLIWFVVLSREEQARPRLASQGSCL